MVTMATLDQVKVMLVMPGVMGVSLTQDSRPTLPVRDILSQGLLVRVTTPSLTQVKVNPSSIKVIPNSIQVRVTPTLTQAIPTTKVRVIPTLTKVKVIPTTHTQVKVISTTHTQDKVIPTLIRVKPTLPCSRVRPVRKTGTSSRCLPQRKNWLRWRTCMPA
jgi:hypothetical protein